MVSGNVVFDGFDSIIQDEKKDEVEKEPIRGCLVCADPGSSDLLLRIDNMIQKIPNKCGVVGEFFDSKRAVNVVKNLFKDPIYDGEADNATLASCGVRVLPSWQLAADKYQRGFMKTSNVLSRMGDEKNDGEEDDMGFAIRTIPDLGMVGIPIDNRMLIVCAGEFDSLNEEVVGRLSSLAVSVYAALK